VATRRTVTVLSPKGGTGKTTVATHLAVALARRRPGLVVLVDLDLAFGDVASALLLDVRRGITDLREGEPIDDVLLHHPSGLHVVGAPDDLPAIDAGVADVVTGALRGLGDRYDTVVVDTGAGLDPITRVAAALATDLVFVVSYDVPSLLGLRKVIGWLDRDGHTSARRHLVVNRAGADAGIEVDDVTATLGMPVAVEIPADDEITAAVNAGRTLTEIDASGPAGSAFDALVRLFEDDEEVAHPSWIDRLLGFGRSDPTNR
jgi:pilus assembly protein CpaE